MSERDLNVDLIKGAAVILMMVQHLIYFQISDITSLHASLYYSTMFATFFCAPAFEMMYGYGIGRQRSDSNVMRQAIVLLTAAVALCTLMLIFMRPGYQITILVNFAIAGLCVQYIVKKKPSKMFLIACIVTPVIATVAIAYTGIGRGVFFPHSNATNSTMDFPLVMLATPIFIGVYVRQFGHNALKSLTACAIATTLIALIAFGTHKEFEYALTITIGSAITLLVWCLMQFSPSVPILSHTMRLPSRFLRWNGENILAIYMTHQIILMIPLYMIGKPASIVELGTQNLGFASIGLAGWSIGMLVLTAVTCLLVLELNKFKQECLCVSEKKQR